MDTNAAGAPAGAVNYKALRFLVVDDSVTMRRVISKCLTDIGAEAVIEAKDGLEALIKVKTSGRIDAVLTDWNMPHMNGFDLLLKLKADPAVSPIPVIMVTTEAEKANVLKAIKAGAKSYLVKPFTPDTLKTRLDQVLGGATA